MSYFTIKEKTVFKIEEKKSIFIANIKMIKSEENARKFINEMKSFYKEARHNVYAYVIGENKGIQRYCDDGEPQGTGGIPILEVLKKNDLTDTIVVVTRYFGGILLGTGGLTRAYSKATAEAIKKAGVVEKLKGTPMLITIDYDIFGKIQYSCSQNKWHIQNIDYTDKVSFQIICESINLGNTTKELIEITSGKIQIDMGNEEYYYKHNNRLIADLESN